MLSSSFFIKTLLALATVAQATPATFGVCSDSNCKDCRGSTKSEGGDYPNCVVYKSADVFGSFIDKNPDTGKWDVWFDVPAATELGPQCFYVIRSPAHIGIDNCGTYQWSSQNAVCKQQPLEDTFMVQYCCGFGACRAAGVPELPDDPPPVKRGEHLDSLHFSLRSNDGMEVHARAAGGGGMLFHDSDGNVIAPLAVGPAQNSAKRGALTFTERRGTVLSARQEPPSCDEGSWQNIGEEYITTAPNTEQVSDLVNGGESGTTIAITETRTSSWSQTIEANLEFGEIIKLGVTFSTTFEETVSDSEEYQFTVPAGETGYVGFTPFLLCRKGSATCGGDNREGEVCTGYKTGGRIAGTYSVGTVG